MTLCIKIKEYIEKNISIEQLCWEYYSSEVELDGDIIHGDCYDSFSTDDMHYYDRNNSTKLDTLEEVYNHVREVLEL